MNNIRKFKIAFKEHQRWESAQGKYPTDATKNFLSFDEQLKIIGFECSEYFYPELLKNLKNIPAKVIRALFRVGRAVAKQEQTINLLGVSRIISNHHRTNYKRDYSKFISSITSEQPYGDFRLIPTVEYLATGLTDPLQIKLHKKLDRINNRLSKMQLVYNPKNELVELNVFNENTHQWVVLYSMNFDMFNFWLDQNKF